MRTVKSLLIFAILLIVFFVKANAQKSDSEIFFDFKNDVRQIKNYYKDYFKSKKYSDEFKLKNSINSFIETVYEDYRTGNSENLSSLQPNIESTFTSFYDSRTQANNEMKKRIKNFISKWNDTELRRKAQKIAADYDYDIDEQLQSIKDLDSDIELEQPDRYDNLRQFLLVIIQDKVELLKLRSEINRLESNVKKRISQDLKNKELIGNLLLENDKRKDLIFQLVETIVNEHKMIASTDYAGEIKPSPFASDIYNMLNSFMDDYINLSRSIQGEPDPVSLNSSLAAYMDVNMKLDSLYSSMEKANMIKQGERDDLLSKSHLWRNQLFPQLDNALKNEFTSRNIPIVFEKSGNALWFQNSLNDFITPYLDLTSDANKDINNSNDIRGRFEEAWKTIKSKWTQSLKISKYADDAYLLSIDQKLQKWQSLTRKSFTTSTFIIFGIIVIGVAIAYLLFRRFRTKQIID